MQLTSVSNGPEAAKAAAKPETFKGYPVVDGKIQGSFYQFSSTIASVQKEYDTQKGEKKGSEEVALWKRPFVFLGNVASNFASMIANAFKTVFFCFFKAEEAKEGEKVADKKDTSKVADKK